MTKRRNCRARWSIAPRLFALVLIALLPSCALIEGSKKPLPRVSPHKHAEETPQPPRPKMTEEEIDSPRADSADSEPDSGSGDPPSVLATIIPSTAPKTAASTRLVEDGRTRLLAGELDAASDRFESAIAIDSNSPYPYFYLGECHYRRKNFDQALTFADRAGAMESSLSLDWQSRVEELRGRILEAAGRFPDARSAYRRAMSLNPASRNARTGLQRVDGSAPVAP